MTSLESHAAAAAVERIENALLCIASGVLKRAEISSREDLFKTYGMQSLTALRVVVAARAQDIALSIVDLYQHRTVCAVARHLAGPAAEVGNAAPSGRCGGGSVT
ncbi:acyl carrier protein [Burkholderia ubonensis]|nr:acyl carrier protein [Burkholderia ubonensis]